MKKAIAFIGLIVLAFSITAFQAPQGNGNSLDSNKFLHGPNGEAVSTGQWISYSAAQLGVNGLTEPGSSTSALSNIIDTRGAKDATLHFVCTQGAITLNVQTYADDGSTTLAVPAPISAVAASTNAMISFGSESNPASNTGTLSTTAIVRLPQRALAFSFTNASATPGTCTARLFVQY